MKTKNNILVRKAIQGFFVFMLFIIPLGKTYSAAAELASPNKKPYLWVYWENLNGAKTPAHISLCRKTLIKHCHSSFNIVELDEKKIHQYIPNLKKIEEILGIGNLIIQQKVDFYRILLLYEYGGFYLDADMIVMKDLKDITDKLKQYDYVGFGITGLLRNWAMASRPKGIFITAVLERLIQLLSSHLAESQVLTDELKIGEISNLHVPVTKAVRLSYGSLGVGLLNTVAEKLVSEGYSYYVYPHSAAGTHDAYGHRVTTQQMFSNRRISYRGNRNLLFIFYVNHILDKKYLKYTEEELLSQDINFSTFVKKSLGDRLLREEK